MNDKDRVHDKEWVCCQRLLPAALSDNYIGALGAAVLANALAKNGALTGLHIKGNELGNEGVKALCEAFRAREARVIALDFGNNRRGAAPLPAARRPRARTRRVSERALQHLRTLRTLKTCAMAAGMAHVSGFGTAHVSGSNGCASALLQQRHGSPGV